MRIRAPLVLVFFVSFASCRSEPEGGQEAARGQVAGDDRVAASAGTVQGRSVEEADPAEAQQDTMEQDPTLALGDSIYRTWCTSCHTQFPPESKPASEWFGTVRKMQQIAEAQGHETLTQEQLFAVTDYLEAEAE